MPKTGRPRRGSDSMFANLVLALAMLSADSKSAPVSLQVKVLERATRHSLELPSFGYWSDAQCDGDANLYFHINNGDYMNPKFFRMSRNGEDADFLGPSGDSSSMEKFGFEDFFVTPAGEPYVLGGDGKKSYVIPFANDGSMKTPIAIETPSAVVVNGFAVFERGDFWYPGATRWTMVRSLRGERVTWPSSSPLEPCERNSTACWRTRTPRAPRPIRMWLWTMQQK